MADMSVEQQSGCKASRCEQQGYAMLVIDLADRSEFYLYIIRCQDYRRERNGFML